MNYKYSDNYDEFTDINEEIEFIKGILGNISIAGKRQKQLLKIYELEYLNNKRPVEGFKDNKYFDEEMKLVELLNKRNQLLVARYTLDFAKANPNIDKEMIKHQLTEYDKNIKETMISILTSAIQVLSTKEDKTLLNKKR